MQACTASLPTRWHLPVRASRPRRRQLPAVRARKNDDEQGRMPPSGESGLGKEAGAAPGQQESRGPGAGEQHKGPATHGAQTQQHTEHHDLHQMLNVDREPMTSDPGDLGRVAEGVIEEAEDIDEHGNPRHPPQGRKRS